MYTCHVHNVSRVQHVHVSLSPLYDVSLSLTDTLCDVPCVRGQHCDEICGKCVCDATKRDVQRCYERAGTYFDHLCIVVGGGDRL